MERTIWSRLEQPEPIDTFVGGIDVNSPLDRLDKVRSQAIKRNNDSIVAHNRHKVDEEAYQKDIKGYNNIDINHNETDPYKLDRQVNDKVKAYQDYAKNGAGYYRVKSYEENNKAKEDLAKSKMVDKHQIRELAKADEVFKAQGGTKQDEDGIWNTWQNAKDISDSSYNDPDITEKLNKLGTGTAHDAFTSLNSISKAGFTDSEGNPVKELTKDDKGNFLLHTEKNTKILKESDLESIYDNTLANSTDFKNYLTHQASDNVDKRFGLSVKRGAQLLYDNSKSGEIYRQALGEESKKVEDQYKNSFKTKFGFKQTETNKTATLNPEEKLASGKTVTYDPNRSQSKEFAVIQNDQKNVNFEDEIRDRILSDGPLTKEAKSGAKGSIYGIDMQKPIKGKSINELTTEKDQQGNLKYPGLFSLSQQAKKKENESDKDYAKRLTGLYKDYNLKLGTDIVIKDDLPSQSRDNYNTSYLGEKNKDGEYKLNGDISSSTGYVLEKGKLKPIDAGNQWESNLKGKNPNITGFTVSPQLGGAYYTGTTTSGDTKFFVKGTQEQQEYFKPLVNIEKEMNHGATQYKTIAIINNKPVSIIMNRSKFNLDPTNSKIQDLEYTVTVPELGLIDEPYNSFKYDFIKGSPFLDAEQEKQRTKTGSEEEKHIIEN